MVTKNFYKRLFDLSYNKKQKPMKKKLYIWLPELFWKPVFASEMANF